MLGHDLRASNSPESELHRRLEGLGASLGAISALIASVSLTAGAAAQVSADGQAAVAKAGQTIESAVNLVRSRGHQHGPDFRVIDPAPDLWSADVQRAHLHGHDPLPVYVNIQLSAQVVGLLLSFGTVEIPHTLSLRITGERGASEITCVSGATLGQLRAAFMSVAALTGVRAEYGGEAGLVLFSDEFGSHAFVRVDLLHPFDAVIGTAGVYRFEGDAFGQPDPTTRLSFQYLAGASDYGQDLVGSINDFPATGDGLSLSVQRQDFQVRLTLSPWVIPQHAFHLGSFEAFRVVRH